MAEFLYSAWFAEDAAYQDDQDREWVACIGIEAISAEQAQEWGDRLARDRASRSETERFLWSSVELRADVVGVTDWSTLPNIRAGQAASDEEIGW
jgi:hypothetical protein